MSSTLEQHETTRGFPNIRVSPRSDGTISVAITGAQYHITEMDARVLRDALDGAIFNLMRDRVAAKIDGLGTNRKEQP